MAPKDSAQTTGDATGEAPGTVVGRRKAARYVVPVAVAGVAAATIGLVPALADSGDPELPRITAQELVEKIAASDEQQLSGTLKISTDLGIPSFGGLTDSLLAGGSQGGDRPSAAPADRLTELTSGTHTLRLAADGPDRQRLSLLDKGSEYSIVHNGDDVWAYDSESDAVFHQRAEGGAQDGPAHKDVPGTPKEMAEKALDAAGDTTSVTVDGTARVAGRDAYQLLIKPKQSGSTVGSVRVAVDAENGVPLKFTLAPSGGGKAVVDAGFTQVDFAKPDASSFSFTPPKGAVVTEADELAAGADDQSGGAFHQDLAGLGDLGSADVIGEGWTSVAVIDAGSGAEGLSGKDAAGLPAEAQGLLGALGDKVTGDFGTGTVFKTRLVNALLTDDGKVYVGAVTKDALVKAADTAR
ncbi:MULTISPECIES: sigma-E factor regulatory protein RseB domain-containing protein [unclassified Streptomyces]|uniref:LolA family protein n=1 Tax=Streptomyces TaxID=1883 RepID=UPI0001C197DA|nr:MULTISPECIES: sigma-E factor regulatory protein RseB domain-containing protein [unclassified Streptomyces]AEN11740.1 conserved hypothetical protein [Streptomyces sp. SirexAA-E]MYR66606.1 DUF2092 domain-containing protein [Streptomyces sp. SID4939]MYS04319.1 DUF2092 domain-containing protein [Streptomyces sp. SID4940]MYT61738.1 DUF2092 domain-containing protein [Streptomyces sp. SID8357]MYT85107.1 DUF2092 domain-containing protein [Streptomyces sp. SID8360]